MTPKIKTPLTDSQHRILWESIATGNTPLGTNEIRSARILTRKRLGTLGFNRVPYFKINKRGLARAGR